MRCLCGASCYLLCLSSDSKGNPYSTASNTILIVDDAAVTLKLLASILRNEGYKVQIASTAEQALSTLRTFRPDLVLVDVHLPVSTPRTLAACADRTVILTGTLLGGYVSDVYNLLYRPEAGKMVAHGYE